MREIKFRAFYKDYGDPAKPNGSMFYDCIPTGSFEEWLIAFDGAENGYDGDFEVGKDIEIMQYTGLKDKNGREIYEGDVLYWNDSRKLEVRWGTVGWVLFSDLFKRLGFPDGDTCSEYNTVSYTRVSEVIGNVYESPELLQ